MEKRKEKKEEKEIMGNREGKKNKRESIGRKSEK